MSKHVLVRLEAGGWISHTNIDPEKLQYDGDKMEIYNSIDELDKAL
jgi:hypothetical protein